MYLEKAAEMTYVRNTRAYNVDEIDIRYFYNILVSPPCMLVK